MNNYPIANPFAVLLEQLNRIECQNQRIEDLLRNNVSVSDSAADPEYIDYKRCKAKYFAGMPNSSLRQKFANHEIPGVTKFGKRLLIHDQTVAQWLRSQQRSTEAEREQYAQAQFEQRHASRNTRQSAS